MKERQIVSAQEMRQLDKLTIKEKLITPYELMTEAGKQVFRHICRNGICDVSEHVMIIAGTGNNGGDALVVGKHLLDKGLLPLIVIIGEEKRQTEESLLIYNELLQNNYIINRVSSYEDLDSFSVLIDQSSVIIDGIFGIGLNSEVVGYHKQVIELINGSYAQKISIDIPSGINADNGLVMGEAVIADHTVVIQNYKQGNLLNDALDYSGELFLLDVGILQTYFPENQLLLNKSYLKNKFPKRKKNSYKYNFGNVLTIGGSKGIMGAPLLTAMAALRSGSGLSTVTYNQKYINHIHNPYPVIMVDTFDGLEEIPNQVRGKSVVVFGPGLGKNDSVNIDILSYLLSLEIPLVVDADGIFYLKQVIKEYSERENIIITPHYNEMATFLDLEVQDVKYEPVLLAKNIAHKYNLTVVLKGTCTIITNEEDTYYSIYGNPGLATAGTGDVLTGVIASLLGRGFTPIESAKLGVLIHSKAAELAAGKMGEESMIATDLIKNLSRVIKNA